MDLTEYKPHNSGYAQYVITGYSPHPPQPE